MPDTRPVWITRDEIETRWSDATLRERWFAAPADPTEAVLRVFSDRVEGSEPTVADHATTASVLRALGYVTNERNDHA